MNAGKTKLMVFTKSKARLRNLPDFTFDNAILERVEDYVYLGIEFNWNGSFVKAKKRLRDKAVKAMYSVIQMGRKLDLRIEVMFKLFDTCVMPILLYGSEVWGFECVEVIEKVHSRFCKM